MFNHQTPSSSHNQDQPQDDSDHDHETIREIHALTSPHPPPLYHHHQRPYSPTIASTESENFSTMSREFNALVLAGTGITRSETSEVGNSNNSNNGSSNLERIREDDMLDNNPLAIVRDDNPVISTPTRGSRSDPSSLSGNPNEVSVQSVKKEEVESKISAWQNAKIAKINNRFKRDDAIINGWENEQVQKSSSWMMKIEVYMFLRHFGKLFFFLCLNGFYVHG